MSRYFNRIALVAVVAFTGTGFLGADVWDKKTVITTDEVMQLPNTTLQPGTYVIKLAESTGNRHIVQFYDKDEQHLVTTVLAIPNLRLQPTGKTVFAFWEVPAGQPKALRAWFYPGDNFGQEFAYPKMEADRITANNKGATVPINDEKSYDLTASETTNKDSNAATVSSTNVTSATEPKEPTSVAAAEPTPAPAAEPTPAPVPAVAEPAPGPAPAQVAAAQPPQQPVERDDAQRVATPAPAPQTLPQTASNLPSVGLIGLLSLCAAAGLNLAYRRG